MKQDSRSPEQNRSLHPHPLPPDIESRVYIHKAILRKNINFKTDSFWFYSQTSFLANTVIYMTPLKVPKCEIFHLFDFNDFYGAKSL